MNWKAAEDKLNFIMNNHNKVDVYSIINIVAPLRQRLYSGERSTRLFKEIMNLRIKPSAKNPAKEKNSV